MNIAVTVAVYNEEKNIEKFIGAIQRQSILPNELIIVDDGSTDKTLEMLKKITKRQLLF